MARDGVAVEPEVANAVARVAYGDPINVSEFCDEHEVSRKTFYKYLKRYRGEGVEGFFPRSRRPHRSPAQVSAAVEDAIVAARKALDDEGWDCGAISIRYRLLREGQLAVVPARATIHRVLVRRGMVPAQPKKKPRRAGRRFTRPRANDLWQMDGFDTLLADDSEAVVIQLLDDCTRLDLACLAAPGETAEAAWQAFLIAAERYGLPRQLLTDNARAFSGQRLGFDSSLTVNLRKLGVEPITSSVRHPQTCGKDERGHQTLQKWLDRQPRPATLQALQNLLDTYHDRYNQERPHQALEGLTPQQRWDIAERSGPDGTPLPQPLHVTRPTISDTGTIGVNNAIIGLGRIHAGKNTTVFRTGHQLTIFIGNRLAGAHTIDTTRKYQKLDEPVTDVLRQT